MNPRRDGVAATRKPVSSGKPSVGTSATTPSPPPPSYLTTDHHIGSPSNFAKTLSPTSPAISRLPEHADPKTSSFNASELSHPHHASTDTGSTTWLSVESHKLPIKSGSKPVYVTSRFSGTPLPHPQALRESSPKPPGKISRLFEPEQGLPSIIEVSPELPRKAESGRKVGRSPLQSRSLSKTSKVAGQRHLEVSVSPGLPLKIFRNPGQLSRFFTQRFLDQIFSQSFKDNRTLLGNVLLMSESFRSIQSIRILPVFIVGEPRDMFEGLWELSNALLEEAAPQTLFCGWVMWSFFADSLLLPKLDKKRLQQLTWQTLWTVLRNMALPKSAFGFGVMMEVTTCIITRQMLCPSEVVESIMTQQPGASATPDFQFIMGQKLVVLIGLAAIIIRSKPEAWKTLVSFASLGLKSHKESIRRKALQLVATLSFAVGERESFLELIVSSGCFDRVHLPALRLVLADTSPLIEAFQYQSTFFLNRKRNKLMEDLAAGYQETLKAGRSPFVQSNYLKGLSQEASLVPKPVRLFAKPMKPNPTKQKIRELRKELEELKTLPLQALADCPFCGASYPGLADTHTYNRHLETECPMLSACPTCDTVVEVRDLTNHMLHECPGAFKNFRCWKCRLALPISEMPTHKDTACDAQKPAPSDALVCPLCRQQLVADGRTLEKTWQDHLAGRRCPGQPRGRT